MSHHFIVPTNENGMSLDQYIATDVQAAMTGPFQFGHVFLFSHGWWTNAIHAMEGYNRFTIEFSRFFRTSPALVGLPLLSVGVHWPSTLTEDEVSVENYFQALSFYTMEKRADAVGVNTAYTLLRLIVDSWQGQPKPLFIHLLGHSFGAKVVCAALERLVEQSDANPIPNGVVFDLALLEAAFDDDELEPQNEYGKLAAALPDLRLLVTHSDKDSALSKLYPAAHKAARLLGKIKPALGAAGPSQAVKDLFGGAAEVDVAPGFAVPAGGLPSQLTVADLTKLHTAHPEGFLKFSGNHSDIFYPEIYGLLSAFYKLV
jgi:Alpha/beta hydrolase of unknown function (DUF900)